MGRLGLAAGWLSPLFGASATPRKHQRRTRALSVQMLETRALMAGDTTPIQFNIPAEVIAMGVYAVFSAQLTADYTNNAGTNLANGTYVYFDQAINDYAAVVDGADFYIDLTANGQQVELPETYVKGGELDIGIGAPPVVSVTNAGLSTPTPATSPTSIYGLVEYASDSGGLDFDLSEVDQVGFPFTITTDPDAAAPANDGVGLNLNRGEFFDRYLPFIASQGATAAPFAQLLEAGLPYRLIAPQDLLSDQQSPTLNPGVLAIGGNLQPSTNYYYWVTATSAFGETAPSNLQRVYTAPLSVSGHQIAQKKVKLNWSAIEGATGYNIYRSLSPNPESALLIGSSSTNKFKDDGLPLGTQTMPTNDYSYNILSSYFNTALTDFFEYYKTHTFSIDKDSRTFSGNAQDNYLYEGHYYTVLALTTPGVNNTFLIFKPFFAENTNIPGAPPAPSWMVDAADSPGQMVFGASGSFADGVEQYPSNAVWAGWQKDIENAIDSAFNRGIATNFSIAPNDWTADPSLYYAPGSTSNWYAAFLHTNITTDPSTGVSINGLAYGYPYDDQGGDSTNFQGDFNLVNINIMPWGTSPTPQSATSLEYLTQPTNGRVGSSETVYFRVLGADGQPFQGGTTVVGHLLGSEGGTFMAFTDPTTGIGEVSWGNTEVGTSMLQLELLDGSKYNSKPFRVIGNSPGGGGNGFARCFLGGKSHAPRSMAVDSALAKLGYSMKMR